MYSLDNRGCGIIISKTTWTFAPLLSKPAMIHELSFGSARIGEFIFEMNAT